MRPRDLPRWRAQTVRHLADPDSALRSVDPAMHADLDSLADHLTTAGLYWVSADMSALAVHAGGQLAETRWTAADRPASSGLMAFEGGVSDYEVGGVRVPVDAITWGPRDEGLLVWLHVSRRRLVSEVAARGSGARVDESRTPPLVPISATVLPLSGDASPGELPAEYRVPLSALAAAWLLMDQPQLTERSVDHDKGPVRRAASRAGLPAPDVTLVELRRKYVPRGDAEDGVEGGRRYRHRWVVSGHWRQQPHGPGREQRRRQWVAAHVKGPDGAPILARERVNVWRR